MEAHNQVRMLDLTLTLVTLAVFGSLAVATIAAFQATGVSALPFFFIVWVVAVPVWSRVVKDWLNERARLAGLSGLEARLLEELAKLREAIESLRRSLEN